MESIYIVGTGGFSKEVYLLAKDCKYEIAGFIDKQHGSFMDCPVYEEDSFDLSNKSLVIAVGLPSLRKNIYNNLNKKYKNINWINLIHPSSKIMGMANGDNSHVKFGIGNVISANNILTSNIIIGNFCQLNLSTTIGHDVVLGDFFTSAPGVHISGNNIIDEEVYFGTNSCSIEKIKITSKVTIGAGACVTKDITDPGTYIGTPARKLVR